MRSEDLNRVIDGFGPSDVQKQRMLENITGHSSTNIRRKKMLAKAFGLAAGVFLCAGTAAAFSNTQLFKEIFGSSIYLVEDQILYPLASAADDRFRLTVEGVLSDAFTSAVIVSVEALNEQGRQELEHIDSSLEVSPLQAESHQTESLQPEIRASVSSIVELEHFSDKSIRRFMIGFRSADGPLTGGLEIRLRTETSRLTLPAPAASTLPTIAVQLDEDHYASAHYVPQTVWISPLSVVVTGVEKFIEYEIPHPHVILHFANGTSLDVFSQGFGGARFPEEGVTTASAQLKRIIDLRQLRSVTVDGKEYPVEEIGTK
jgi:hypothetical protein